MCSSLAGRERCQARDVQTDHSPSWTDSGRTATPWLVAAGVAGLYGAVPAPNLAAADDPVGNLHGSFTFGLAIIVPIACFAVRRIRSD